MLRFYYNYSTNDPEALNNTFYRLNHSQTNHTIYNELQNYNHNVYNYFSSLHYKSVYSMVLVAVILGMIVVLMVLGNLLVIASLVKFKKLRSVSNFLIGNLAASDFLIAVTVLPFSTFNECLGKWLFGRVACNVWLLTDVLYCTASIWNICAIAFDRYTATLFPLWYRERRSSKQACIYISSIWCISLITCSPPLFGWNDLSKNYIVIDNSSDTHGCVLFDTPSYVIYSAFFSFYIPFLFTLLLYIQIFIILRKRLRFMNTRNSKASQDRGGTKVSLKVTKASDSGSPLKLSFRKKRWSRGSKDCIARKETQKESSKPVLRTQKSVNFVSDNEKGETSQFGRVKELKSCANLIETNKKDELKEKVFVNFIDNLNTVKNEFRNLENKNKSQYIFNDVENCVVIRREGDKEEVECGLNNREKKNCKLDLEDCKMKNKKDDEDILRKQKKLKDGMLNSPGKAGNMVEFASEIENKKKELSGITSRLQNNCSKPFEKNEIVNIISKDDSCSDSKNGMDNRFLGRMVVQVLEVKENSLDPHVQSSVLMCFDEVNNLNVENNDLDGFIETIASGIIREALASSSHHPSNVQCVPLMNERLTAKNVSNLKSITLKSNLNTSSLLPTIADKLSLHSSSDFPTTTNTMHTESTTENTRTTVKTSFSENTCPKSRGSMVKTLDKRTRSDRREMRATIRMAAVIGAFCGMWLGFFTIYLIEGVCKSCVIPRTVTAFFFWLGYTNSAINPILYAIFNDEFRNAFKKILRFKNKPTKR